MLFELGARPHPPQELYRAYLAQSDIFIGLYWQRYGWVGPDMDISGLEDEFRLSDIVASAVLREDAGAGPRAGADRDARASSRPTAPSRTDVRDRRRARPTRARRPRAVVERAVHGTWPKRPVAEPTIERSARLAGPVDLVDRAGRGHRRGRQAARRPDVRLVTLTGPGGIGKTRLAIAVGERRRRPFRGGRRVRAARVDQRTEPGHAPHRRGLGAPVEGTAAAVDAVVEHVGDTPTLLVLDNLEQLTAVAPELDELLARCPGLEILATSRTVLRLRAEREYPVAPLTVPNLAEVPPVEALASLPAVQLFVDRAQAVRYDFALDADNAVAVAEISRRLDGLPLAIELAAARVRLLDPAALLERLDESLDALGSGPVDLPERQRTLRATVEWSIGLLDEAERDMLTTLVGVRRRLDSRRRHSVADVGEDATLDLLDSLAGHSLVKVEATHLEPRFRMLETVREIAAERLAAAGGLCRGRAATRDVLRRDGFGCRVASRSSNRMGGPTARGRGEHSSRDPLVLRP